MIKFAAISAGLVGLTAMSGMALSMAHDIAFTPARSVGAETGLAAVEQVAFVQPAPGSVEAEAMIVGSVAVEPAEAEVIPAILESVGPYNRLAGKSAMTASLNAPTEAIRPEQREVEFADNFVTDDFIGRNNPRDADDSVVVSIVRPVFTQRALTGYANPAPRPVAASAPIAAAVSSGPVSPAPSFLVGVYR